MRSRLARVRLLALPLTFAAAALAGARAVAAQEPSSAQRELEAETARIRAQIEELRGEKFLRPVEVRVTDRAGFVSFAK